MKFKITTPADISFNSVSNDIKSAIAQFSNLTPYAKALKEKEVTETVTPIWDKVNTMLNGGYKLSGNEKVELLKLGEKLQWPSLKCTDLLAELTSEKIKNGLIDGRPANTGMSAERQSYVDGKLDSIMGSVVPLFDKAVNDVMGDNEVSFSSLETQLKDMFSNWETDKLQSVVITDFASDTETGGYKKGEITLNKKPLEIINDTSKSKAERLQVLTRFFGTVVHEGFHGHQETLISKYRNKPDQLSDVQQEIALRSAVGDKLLIWQQQSSDLGSKRLYENTHHEIEAFYIGHGAADRLGERIQANTDYNFSYTVDYTYMSDNLGFSRTVELT